MEERWGTGCVYGPGRGTSIQNLTSLLNHLSILWRWSCLRQTLDVLRSKMMPCVQWRPWWSVLTMVYSVVVWQWVDVMLFIICMIWQSLLLIDVFYGYVSVKPLHIKSIPWRTSDISNQFLLNICGKVLKLYITAFLYLFKEHNTKKLLFVIL